MSVSPLRPRLLAGVAASMLVPLALVGGPAYAEPARPPGPTDAELQAALDRVVTAGASGVLLEVHDGHGRTVRLTSGAARLQPRETLTPGMRVRVGSITKTFVAVLVLQTQAAGQLTLDDTVEQWLPGLVPNGTQITVRELLDHTSGLYDVVRDPDFFQAVFTHPLRHYTPRQLVGIATAHPPRFAPGNGWGYSNTDYVLLGMILERATGRPVSALLRRGITRPLGLHDTYLPTRSPDLRGDHAHGYLPPSEPGGGYRDLTRISPTALGTAGAVVSTADDLQRFYRALLGGRLLGPTQLAEMRTTVHAGPGYRYGLGLYTRRTPCGRVWGHDGNAPGYETYAWNDASGRRSFVLTVTTQPDDAIEAAENQAVAAATCRMLDRSP